MPADLKPATSTVKVVEDNDIVEEAKVKGATLDLKQPVSLFKNVLFGLIVLAVAICAFVYFGGVQRFKRLLKRRKRVGNTDLEK